MDRNLALEFVRVTEAAAIAAARARQKVVPPATWTRWGVPGSLSCTRVLQQRPRRLASFDTRPEGLHAGPIEGGGGLRSSQGVRLRGKRVHTGAPDLWDL